MQRLILLSLPPWGLTLWGLTLWGLLAVGAARGAENTAATVPQLFQAVSSEKVPFDRRNFIQGMEFYGDQLYVSSGLYGQSAIRMYQWPDMGLVKERRLPDHLFGEGLTRIDDRLYVLTWRARRLLILDANTLEDIASLRIPGEGWGMTHDGTHLYYSDGSHRIRRIDTSVRGSLDVINVTYRGRRVTRLNELEWIDGEIWANVWQTDQIVRIDPTTGRVTGVISADGLLEEQDREPGTDVLNGIAQHDSGAIWLTGKRWPWLYRIALESRD